MHGLSLNGRTGAQLRSELTMRNFGGGEPCLTLRWTSWMFSSVDWLVTGHHHPALCGIDTTKEVEKLRPHLKMLTGDYLTYSRIALDRGTGDPCCRICRSEQPLLTSPPETIAHILTECRGTSEVRERIFPELLTELSGAKPDHVYLTHPPSFHKLDLNLAQFILDCTSFNLENSSG